MLPIAGQKSSPWLLFTLYTPTSKHCWTMFEPHFSHHIYWVHSTSLRTSFSWVIKQPLNSFLIYSLLSLHFILHSSARVSLLKHETDNIFFFFNFIFNTQSIFFLLRFSWLTMLWYFQSLSREGTQPHIYTHPFSPKPTSHPGWHITLSRVPCAIQ